MNFFRKPKTLDYGCGAALLTQLQGSWPGKQGWGKLAQGARHLFDKNISLLAWKKLWILLRKILKCNGKSIFFTLLNMNQNAPFKKKKNSNYSVLYEKNAFRFNFGPREVPQPENAWKWKCMFSGWGTLRGPKSNLKAFF